MENEKTCAFTGHRDLGDDVDVEFMKSVVKNVYESGYTTFLCGMARGFDLLAAEAVISLRKQLKNIKLVACVPCGEQSKYFGINDRKKYEEILGLCDEIKVLSGNYYRGCMLVRDRFMVDNSSLLIAYAREQEGKKDGGTFYTLNYAKKKNKEIYLV